MPIIYTYPTVTPVSEDLLLLSDSSDVKTTKTATIESVLEIGLTTTKVTLSAAEINALDVAPVNLINAPGVGKAIAILDCRARLNWNSVAFNTGEIRLFQTDLAASYSHYLGSAWRAYVTDSYALTRETGFIPGWGENLALKATASAAGGVGNSTIDLWITYKVITL